MIEQNRDHLDPLESIKQHLLDVRGNKDIVLVANSKEATWGETMVARMRGCEIDPSASDLIFRYMIKIGNLQPFSPSLSTKLSDSSLKVNDDGLFFYLGPNNNFSHIHISDIFDSLDRQFIPSVNLLLTFIGDFSLDITYPDINIPERGIVGSTQSRSLHYAQPLLPIETMTQDEGMITLGCLSLVNFACDN